MSNFKNFTSKTWAEFEQKQLARRLDAQQEKPQITDKARREGKEAKARTKRSGETANSITANVIRAINMQPKCVAYRINNVGVWDAEKQIHRRGNTQKGIFDVCACIKGRTVWIEIKAGRDKPSREQLIFQQEVIGAGGIAEFVHSTDEFLKLLTRIIVEI